MGMNTTLHRAAPVLSRAMGRGWRLAIRIGVAPEPVPLLRTLSRAGIRAGVKPARWAVCRVGS